MSLRSISRLILLRFLLAHSGRRTSVDIQLLLVSRGMSFLFQRLVQVLNGFLTLPETYVTTVEAH
ncbi:hypothetical protein N7492_009698 [Penicillium capsulatum]|uniref:Secreted protein n=1 Tax=Penicillium capsulatum TaxID=69766 RepID=A0A9W9HLT0_9EURO|nr:hypothetical protein N7492_009698 [Penicillium capsulatum]